MTRHAGERQYGLLAISSSALSLFFLGLCYGLYMNGLVLVVEIYMRSSFT